MARATDDVQQLNAMMHPGLSIIYETIMAIIIETAHDYALTGSGKGVEILSSKLGDDAGITGAAVLARRESLC